MKYKLICSFICAQCGKVVGDEVVDDGEMIRPLPPEINFFCSTKCIKAYNTAHDISNDGLEDRSC